jgi:hypothetical protein
MKYNKIGRTRESINKVVTKYFYGQMPSSKEITQQILKIPDPETQCFIALAYLSGDRVSELTRYYIRKTLTLQENGIKTKQYNPEYNPSNKFKPSIRKMDLKVVNKKAREEFNLDDTEWQELQNNPNINLILVIRSRNLKNKKILTKKALAPFDLERELVDLILDYVKDLQPEDEIFPTTRNKMWIKLQQYAPWFIYNHLIRSFRIVILQNEYGLKNHQIRKWMGWGDDRPFSNYDAYLLDYEVADDMLRAKA